MDVAALRTQLERFPDDTEVFIWADRGQNYENASSVEFEHEIEAGLCGEVVDGFSVVIYGL
jgi:hypothetical protein